MFMSRTDGVIPHLNLLIEKGDAFLKKINDIIKINKGKNNFILPLNILERKEKVEKCLEKLRSIVAQGNDRGVSGRNKNAYIATICNMLVTGMGGVILFKCKSGKDRTGINELNCDATAAYYEQNKELPDYNEEANSSKRQSYANTLNTLFKSQKIQKAAYENTTGALGVKDNSMSRIVDSELKTKIQSNGNKLASLNKPEALKSDEKRQGKKQIELKKGQRSTILTKDLKIKDVNNLDKVDMIILSANDKTQLDAKIKEKENDLQILKERKEEYQILKEENPNKEVKITIMESFTELYRTALIEQMTDEKMPLMFSWSKTEELNEMLTSSEKIKPKNISILKKQIIEFAAKLNDEKSKYNETIKKQINEIINSSYDISSEDDLQNIRNKILTLIDKCDSENVNSIKIIGDKTIGDRNIVSKFPDIHFYLEKIAREDSPYLRNEFYGNFRRRLEYLKNNEKTFINNNKSKIEELERRMYFLVYPEFQDEFNKISIEVSGQTLENFKTSINFLEDKKYDTFIAEKEKSLELLKTLREDQILGFQSFLKEAIKKYGFYKVVKYLSDEKSPLHPLLILIDPHHKHAELANKIYKNVHELEKKYLDDLVLKKLP